MLALLLMCRPCCAGSTDPDLAIAEVVARAAGQTAVVEVAGNWAFDDILQVDFPFSVVVSQGAVFARYEVGQPAQSGTFSGLTDGFQLGEIAGLEAAGTPDADARFVVLSPRRIVLALPASISNGPLTVVGYVVVPGDGVFLSNSVTTTLSGVGGGP